MKIAIVAGARPNFMKISPIVNAIKSVYAAGSPITYRIIHTGQHYDDKLSNIFFEQLGIPNPDVNLGAGSGSQAEQTARIMVEFEKYLTAHTVDLVMVVGDVTSTLACTIVAKKLNIKVAHVEAGIRSFDMTMPEEINRLVTDSITDFFFTTSEFANQNLLRAGVPAEKIFFVGNTMIDTLKLNLERAIKPIVLSTHGLSSKEFCVLTLHRPSNVDNVERFKQMMTIIDSGCERKVIFPVHPRSMKNLGQMDVTLNNILPVEPLSYLEFIYLLREAKAVITDSGGVQEETTALGIPCFTLRNNTERPETITLGTNQLIGENLLELRNVLQTINSGVAKAGRIPPLWDGRAADRIVEILCKLSLK